MQTGVQMAAVLDDIDARPGSTTSYLRTIVGLYLRRLDGWIPISDLVTLMEDVGIPPARTRTGVVRLKQKQLLLPERRGAIGYAVNPRATDMLVRGDRRIFTITRMSDADQWCLVSFSIPESRRDLRHQLRRRLQWIGCGVVSPALWICPDYLTDEVEGILGELDVRAYATLFRASAPRVSGSLRDAVASWWDLDGLRAEHDAFLTTIASLPAAADASDREAFISYVKLVDAWRVLPYVDPGLPASLLPDDWPGEQSFDGFTTLSERFADAAWAHVRAVTGTLHTGE